MEGKSGHLYEGHGNIEDDAEDKLKTGRTAGGMPSKSQNIQLSSTL